MSSYQKNFYIFSLCLLFFYPSHPIRIYHQNFLSDPTVLHLEQSLLYLFHVHHVWNLQLLFTDYWKLLKYRRFAEIVPLFHRWEVCAFVINLRIVPFCCHSAWSPFHFLKVFQCFLIEKIPAFQVKRILWIFPFGIVEIAFGVRSLDVHKFVDGGSFGAFIFK